MDRDIVINFADKWPAARRSLVYMLPFRDLEDLHLAREAVRGLFFHRVRAIVLVNGGVTERVSSVEEYETFVDRMEADLGSEGGGE